MRWRSSSRGVPRLCTRALAPRLPLPALAGNDLAVARREMELRPSLSTASPTCTSGRTTAVVSLPSSVSHAWLRLALFNGDSECL